MVIGHVIGIGIFHVAVRRTKTLLLFHRRFLLLSANNVFVPVDVTVVVAVLVITVLNFAALAKRMPLELSHLKNAKYNFRSSLRNI